jgi:hypothetical protein
MIDIRPYFLGSVAPSFLVPRKSDFAAKMKLNQQQCCQHLAQKNTLNMSGNVSFVTKIALYKYMTNNKPNSEKNV